MNKILVTGASGFIGRHLIERLRRDGHSVRALVHHSDQSGEWPETVEVVAGDARDAQAMKTVVRGCDTVFHLAGKVHDFSELEGEDATYFAVNVEGTRHVLEGAVAYGDAEDASILNQVGRGIRIG